MSDIDDESIGFFSEVSLKGTVLSFLSQKKNIDESSWKVLHSTLSRILLPTGQDIYLRVKPERQVELGIFVFELFFFLFCGSKRKERKFRGKKYAG